MNQKDILLHLSLIEGIGPATIKALCNAFTSLNDVYCMTAYEIAQRAHVSGAIAHKIERGLSDRALLEQEQELCVREDISYIALGDAEYPVLLSTIYAPPPIVYVQGTLPRGPALSVVGSRLADAYGAQCVRDLLAPCVSAGFTMVSGGALGIDTMAHEEALRADGATVAVVGSGLLNPYPATNRKLFREIRDKGGALMSIFPIAAPAAPGNFPARNRIIAGMSRVCLVVQAASQSGALITAQSALDEGREVVAVPGRISDPLSAGCNRLIAQGAGVISSPGDLLRVLGIEDSDSVLVRRPKNSPEKHVDSDPLVTLCQTSSSFDELMDKAGLSFSELHARLTALSLAGKVTNDLMGNWRAL